MIRTYDETEEETKLRYITPALTKAGWSLQKMLMEYDLRKDRHRIMGDSNESTKVPVDQSRNRPDYLLCRHMYMPLAVVEAKKSSAHVAEGLDQAITYAKTLDIPFAYSTNGRGFVEFNLKTAQQRELKMDEFPSPDELWQRWCEVRGVTHDIESMIDKGPYYTSQDKEPRYYQMVAINKTVNAIMADKRKRLLLVMATGTGKTYTAFQIIHRLLKAGAVKNVLYLADRNQLVDQTMVGDFQPLSKILTKIRSGKINKNYQIFFGLYQQLKGNEEGVLDDGTSLSDHFRQVPKDFFDLIVVDECHRGSASEESSWRSILDYFESAIQVGLTATPNEKEGANNTEYFGNPIYTYSLKQGIEDGYLAPYRVRYVALDKDVYGWEPEEGELDDNGNPIPLKLYNVNDFDRSIILKRRTQAVARVITQYLHKIGRMSKTIVFCVNQRHALELRDALRDCNKDLVLENHDYIVRMTANDEDGKRLYDDFISVSQKYPVVVTTSKLLTTGADTKCVKLIVLDAPIRSMTEFKQIIGRGSRLNEAAGKTFFTILDFRQACNLFKDEEFDGTPDNEADWGEADPIWEPKPDEPSRPTEKPSNTDKESMEPSTPRVVYTVDNVPVTTLGVVDSFLNDEGKLVTDKFIDFTRGNILKLFDTAADFVEVWNRSKEKQAIIEQLNKNGVSIKELQQLMGSEFDEFDLILSIAFGATPLTRGERSSKVARSRFLEKYQGVARTVLEHLLTIYAREGASEINDTQVLRRPEFKELKGIPRIMDSFGGQEGYRQAVAELESALYFIPSGYQSGNAMSI